MIDPLTDTDRDHVAVPGGLQPSIATGRSARILPRVQEHVGARGARAGFERGQAGDYPHRASGQLQHRARAPR